MFDYIKNRDGRKLFVVVDHPKGNGPFPAVVLVHGFKGFSSQRHIQGISDGLVEEGFLVVRPDLTSNPGRSYLEMEDVTYKQEFLDTMDTVDSVSKMRGVNRNKVGIAGHSLSGMIVAEVASKSKLIKALAILSGVYSFELIAEKIFKKPYERAQKDFKTKGFTKVWSVELEKRLKIKKLFVEDMIGRTADEFATNINCPTLVISSGRDEAVSQKHADNWMKNIGVDDKKMEIIEGSDHNYSDEALSEVGQKVADWFKSKLV